MSLVVAEKKARASDGDVEATQSPSDANALSSSLTTLQSLDDFLTNNGLEAFVKRFREQGFLNAGEVLGLTPRKYKAVGVSRGFTKCSSERRFYISTPNISQERAVSVSQVAETYTVHLISFNWTGRNIRRRYTTYKCD